MLGEYKHYKGGVYEVTGMAYDPETYQTVVMYKNEDGVTFIRTVENFFEFVDDNEGTFRPRFEYVQESRTDLEAVGKFVQRTVSVGALKIDKELADQLSGILNKEFEPYVHHS